MQSVTIKIEEQQLEKPFMRILIVGGSGAIGGHVALHLSSLGHEVVISSRKPPMGGTGLEKLEWMQGNYQDDTFSEANLSRFEGIVFAAGNDIRHLPTEGETNADAHYLWANGEKIPEFAALAKRAAVKFFINIGSFYPQILPDIIATDAYVRSRDIADQEVCALSDEGFRAMSLNAPFVVGLAEGMGSDMFAAYINYARNMFPHIKPFAPAGGTNFLSVQSLSEAVAGALERGVGGTSYLLGDENLSFAKFFGLFFTAAGNPQDLAALDEEHPMLPDSAIMQGRGNVISYEPNTDEAALLRYRRGDIARAVTDMVADFDRRIETVSPVVLGPEASDIPELGTLAKLYARANDANQPEILAEIMTDDIVVQGPGFRIEGHEAVCGVPAMLRQFYHNTEHIVHQTLARISGDTAVGETYSTAHHVLHPEKDKLARVMTWHIRYQDHFLNTNGKWRFQYRGLLLDWMEVREIEMPVSPKTK